MIYPTERNSRTKNSRCSRCFSSINSELDIRPRTNFASNHEWPKKQNRLVQTGYRMVIVISTGLLFVTILFFLANLSTVEAASPSGNYAPGLVKCPDGELVRVANGLSEEEIEYVETRNQNDVYYHQVQFFNRIKIPDFDTKSFFKTNKRTKHKPTLGLGMAVSGGGVRAMLTGAGGLSALDARTPGATQPGHVGGLLQSMSYLTGLSGGAWLLGSIMMNSMPTVSQVISENKGWDFTVNPLLGEMVDIELEQVFESNVLTYVDEYLAKKRTQLSFRDEIHSAIKQRQMNQLNVMISNSTGVKTVYAPYSTDVVQAEGFRKSLIHNLMPGERISRYYETLYSEIQPKKLAGFDISVTDFWARALAKVFLGGKLRQDMAWSDVVHTPAYKKFKMPYPILTANALVPKTIPEANTSTIIEMSPHETGSWSPTLGAFVKTRYAGTHLFNGIVQSEDGRCIRGFDNGAFIVATSSSLFNDLAAMGIKHLDSYPQIRRILTKYKTLSNFFNWSKRDLKAHADYSLFRPNPFKGFHRGVSHPSPAEMHKGVVTLDTLFNIKEKGNAYTNSDTLYLVDGGEDDLNIPLDPLLRAERKMDMVIALDVSIDKANHPNGTALYRHTWRYHGKEHIHNISFPIIPTPEEIVEKQHYAGPRFFGCDLDAYPDADTFGGSSPDTADFRSRKPALIVYMPNQALSYNSQQPTTRLIYKKDAVLGMVENGYNIFTQRNSTEWVQCLGCAAIHREVVRRDEEWPEFCQMCFDQYCVT